MREPTLDFFDKVPLGVEGLELVQHAVGSVEGSKLDLIAVALTLMKIKDPLLSPQFDEIVKSGALLIIGHGEADSGPGTVKVSLGPTECALGSFELALECLDPRLCHYSQALLLLERCLERCLLGERVLVAEATLFF